MYDAADAQRQKKALRRQFAATRRSTSTSAPDNSGMRASLFARQLLWGARHVALYASMEGEVDTGPLIQQLRRDGVTTYLPQVCGRGRAAELRFFACPDGSPLRRHPGGMLEPVPLPGAVPVAASQLDAVVLPGLAFDMRGGRLGKGWGCYDRALSDYPGLVVGLAHQQQICAPLPLEPHDRRVDVVVTPFGVFVAPR